jgi:GNAT superfamily N-acetyltransferase
MTHHGAHETNAAVTIAALARHRPLLPLVAEWFVNEWPAWYGPGGPGNVVADLSAFAGSEQTLPVGVIAFLGDQPVGAGALKAESIPSHRHLTPWAAAGFVLPQCRGRGIGALLLRALVAKADELGYDAVYCGTGTSATLLARCGWEPFETTALDGQPLTIYRFVHPGGPHAGRALPRR